MDLSKVAQCRRGLLMHTTWCCVPGPSQNYPCGRKKDLCRRQRASSAYGANFQLTAVTSRSFPRPDVDIVRGQRKAHQSRVIKSNNVPARFTSRSHNTTKQGRSNSLDAHEQVPANNSQAFNKNKRGLKVRLFHHLCTSACASDTEDGHYETTMMAIRPRIPVKYLLTGRGYDQIRIEMVLA